MAKWTPKHEAPEPLEGPVVATITGGTIVWFVLFLVQLPFYGWFDDHGHTWWLWTCLAGAGLGLIGVWYVRKRDAAIKRAAAARESTRTERPASERSASDRPTSGHTASDRPTSGHTASDRPTSDRSASDRPASAE